MSIYEILPALDLTQSVHAKISIGMHRGVKLKIFRIPLIGLETRLRWRTDRKFLRNPNLNEITSTTIHWISRYTRNREYFGTRWRRGKVLCVYSKHNNGKDRSREDHAASPSICKEYYMKTRQTIQVGSGKLVILNRVD